MIPNYMVRSTRFHGRTFTRKISQVYPGARRLNILTFEGVCRDTTSGALTYSSVRFFLLGLTLLILLTILMANHFLVVMNDYLS